MKRQTETMGLGRGKITYLADKDMEQINALFREMITSQFTSATTSSSLISFSSVKNDKNKRQTKGLTGADVIKDLCGVALVKANQQDRIVATHFAKVKK
ncbi:hypothetical protein P8452_10378 [Trifolium repens]|nr:hypothetical protein P8452_10378 [Trifolium repens]